MGVLAHFIARANCKSQKSKVISWRNSQKSKVTDRLKSQISKDVMRHSAARQMIYHGRHGTRPLADTEIRREDPLRACHGACARFLRATVPCAREMAGDARSIPSKPLSVPAEGRFRVFRGDMPTTSLPCTEFFFGYLLKTTCRNALQPLFSKARCTSALKNGEPPEMSPLVIESQISYNMSNPNRQMRNDAYHHSTDTAFVNNRQTRQKKMAK